MHRSLQTSMFVLCFGVSAFSLPGNAQDRIRTPAMGAPIASTRETPSEMPEPARTSEFSARQPAITIGGPFGVVIGGGYGVRFGGPNGAQFGGGVGAQFGGRNGVQFGGGEGVRIGPSAEYANPGDGATDTAADRTTPMSGAPAQIVIHHPASASETLRVRINDQDMELSAGETISLSGQRRVSVQFVNANGRNGPRRSLAPGNYIARKTRRGWTLARSDTPIGPPAAEQGTTHLPTALDLNPPQFEQVLTPNTHQDSVDE